MNDIVEYSKPFNNIQNLLKAIYIIKSSRFLCSEQIVEIIYKFTDKKLTCIELSNFEEKIDLYDGIYPSEFFSELKNFEIKYNDYLHENCLPVVIIQTDSTTCIQCKKVITRQKRYDSIIYYCSKPSQKCVQISLNCCDISHFYSYSRNDKKELSKTTYNEDALAKEFISFTSMTVFETKIFEMLLADLIFKNSTFIGFTNSFNMVNTGGHRDLCIKRLIEGFFYYNILKFYTKNDALSQFNAPFVEKLDSAIDVIRPSLVKNFATKWSDHKENCNHKDCSKSLNVDGLWKVVNKVLKNKISKKNIN
jgi:hypothetical protein